MHLNVHLSLKDHHQHQERRHSLAQYKLKELCFRMCTRGRPQIEEPTWLFSSICLYHRQGKLLQRFFSLARHWHQSQYWTLPENWHSSYYQIQAFVRLQCSNLRHSYQQLGSRLRSCWCPSPERCSFQLSHLGHQLQSHQYSYFRIWRLIRYYCGQSPWCAKVCETFIGNPGHGWIRG